MWRKHPTAILYLVLSYTFIPLSSSTPAFNHTGQASTPPSIISDPHPLTKTEILCYRATHRTTVSAARAYIARLSKSWWAYQSLSWSRSIHANPGHLPTGMPLDGTELLLFAKNDGWGTEAIRLADWLTVLEHIVEECISQRRWTGGKAYVGEVVGLTFGGVWDEGERGMAEIVRDV